MDSRNLLIAPSSVDLCDAVGAMTDACLEERLQCLAWLERRALTALLVHLSEFDSRRLYADRGQPSLFAYCRNVLGYSEQGAYKRIQAARAAREHPVLLERLASGDIHLAGIVVLAPHLRQENAVGLLDAARGKSIRELERVAAGLSPQEDAADRLRALPQPPSAAAVSSPRDLLDALSVERFLFRFTGGRNLYDEYHRIRDLLRLGEGTGTMEVVFQRSLEALLDRLDPLIRHQRRRGKTRSGSGSKTRAIPASLRDAVWARDGGRCTFLSPEAERCPAVRWLEIDHITPYALGGRSDDIDNLRLLCRAHNQLMARRVFGQAVCRRSGQRSGG